MSEASITAHPLELFFNPESVAIIGASSDPNKLGGKPIRYLLSAGYAGRIYPINPNSDTIQGLRAFRSLHDIEEPVDQALIIVPAAVAVDALRDCIDKGIRAVQVLSSGFAEESAEGAKRQQELVELASQHDVHLLGPNCLGVVSVRNRYFATFSTALETLTPRPGVISFATQSGAFGSCAYALAIQRDLGIARIIATGNEADIDVTACIDFLASDEDTHVICAAIEGCRDGQRLREALHKAARANKPVVLMKVGSSAVGQVAAATHTGAIAGDDRIFDEICREYGAWRAGSIEEMLDIAYICSQLPAPDNDRATIITVSGGIGVLMADDADRARLDTPPLPSSAQEDIKAIVPFLVGTNPLDTTAQIGAIPNGIPDLVDYVMKQTDCSSHFIYLAQIPCNSQRFVPMLEALAAVRDSNPGQLMILVGPSDDAMRRQVEHKGLVIFADPSRAVRTLGAICEMQRRRNSLRSRPEDVPMIDRTPRFAPSSCLGNLSELEAKAWLKQYGLPVLSEALCSTASDAVEAADQMGYPVVAKIVSPDLQHKTELGGVILNIQTAQAVRDAFDILMQRARSHNSRLQVDGISIAPMVRGGVETILGIHIDPIFGPMIMFGLGGVAVELYRDVAFASVPVSSIQADQLISRVKAAGLLKGWRGSPAADISTLKDAILALSDFASDWSHILEGVDINPFVVLPEGGACLDAVISLKAAPRVAVGSEA